MNVKPLPGIARFDSAAGMVQALALCLHGQPFDSPSQSPLLDRLMPLANPGPTDEISRLRPGGLTG